MNKTLNQRVYEVPPDVKKAIYDSGYEDGISSGKLCATQQILDDLEELLTKRRDEYKQNRAAHPEIDFPEANVYWTGRLVSYGEMLKAIKELKKKYEVD